VCGSPEAGEAAIIRNVGGRVTPSTIDTLAMVRQVTRAAGGDLAAGWNLVVLHHTDCIRRDPEEGCEELRSAAESRDLSSRRPRPPSSRSALAERGGCALLSAAQGKCFVA